MFGIYANCLKGDMLDQIRFSHILHRFNSTSEIYAQPFLRQISKSALISRPAD
jgi:hypothetical protein